MPKTVISFEEWQAFRNPGNNRYVLTIVEHCTRWAEAYKCNTTVSHVCPETLITDNGAEFVAREFLNI